MSILIKGINKPQNCWDCWFELCTGKYPDNCPLVEVPTPHGRLIDADKLLEAIKYLPYGYRGIIKDVIYNQPTVIESDNI